MSLSQSLHRLRSVWLIFVLATTAVLILVACGGAASEPTAPSKAGEVQVKIIEKNEEYSFDQGTVTVAKGTKVVWTNSSDAPHTVTSDSGDVLNSPTLNQNSTYEMVFNTAGTYDYTCTFHPNMTGKVVVNP